MTTTLGPRWFGRDALDVAPDLLHKVIVVDDGGALRSVRIVEVEAYAEGDPASHAFRGPSLRNATMFGPPGRLYVYFTYGMHWCVNVVTGPAGSGQAVLLRAGEPLAGIALMSVARRGAPERDLCRGPARLAQALGLDRGDDGRRLGAPGARRIRIIDDGVPPPASPASGPRVGITKAAAAPWRWWVADSAWVSVFRAGGPRSRAGGRRIGTAEPDRR
ncbi:MAG: DNA-3-methyladenine glycosylase [Acidimicrobiales bacterium]